MRTTKCFINDLKELMLLHNIKNFDFTGNIIDGKLFVQDISAIDFDGNERFPINMRR